MIALTAFALPADAQPKIENARLEARNVSGSLDASFRTIVSSQTEPAWIGYSVAQISGERSMCGTVSLEGARDFVMLFRVVGGQVEKIRTYASDCIFDGGGLPIYWLNGVNGEQSASLLATFIPATTANLDTREQREVRNLANTALYAIARHKDGAPTLIDLARRTQISPQMRQEAFRALGRSKDPRAIQFFEQILTR